MLIYSSDKKFIGIDDESLHTLGFSNSSDMLSECSDIAELFVKKPGYVHNFKNFPWIDFVLHADAGTAKAIVQSSRKQFSCEIVIKPFHMVDQPEAPAYAVYLQHIHALDSSEEAAVTSQVDATSVPEPAQPAAAPLTPPPFAKPEPQEPEPFAAPEPEPFTPPIPEPETPATEAPAPLDMDDDIPAAFAKPLEIEDDIFMDAAPDSEPETIEPEPLDIPEEAPSAPATASAAPAGGYTAEEQEYINNLTVPSDYTFDPQVAADELGLPVDLIEEFIGDFINQAHDFHDELFDSAAKSDFDNVKILSHKLKGVAANLRVEDALEMLTIVNNSHDQIEVEANLKAFYRVIAKLEGKEIDVAPAAAAIPEAAVPAAEADDDIYDFDIAKSNTKEASETEAEKEPADSDDDDIYAFDLPTAEPEPKTVDADEPEEDLYSPAVTSEEDDDLYSIEPVTPAADASPSLDDDIELPPMDMSLLDEPKEESPTKTRSDDVELPPMDMSLLDESKATESFDDVELPPMPSLEDDLPESASVPELHYDAAQAAAEIGLPASLVEELTKDFVSDAEGVKADLTAAAEAVNVAEWQSIASTLKGAADNLRMTEVAEALRSLANANDEQKAKESVDMFYGYVTQLKK